MAAKLHAPRLRDDELPRAVLVDALCSARVPVVAVRAGAGYGKTTPVRQWIQRDERASAWLTVPVDPQLMFDTPSTSMWEVAIRRLGIEPHALAPAPGVH